nr:hypothetical protein [Tanacetum cinerariifolium]
MLFPSQQMVFNSPCLIYKKELIHHEGQTTTGKENSNPFMAGSLPKTILLSFLQKICFHMSPFEFTFIYLVVTSLYMLNRGIDSPLLGVNIPRSDEDRLKLMKIDGFLAIKGYDAEGVVCLPNEEIFIGLAQMGYEKPSTKLTFNKAFFSKGVDCLPNEEIFAELARMGYEKPSTKLTFYKDFFSSQLKFLIHTILQSMSAKRTSWNEFSSAMASAVICFSTGKGFSGVETPLFEGMLIVGVIEEEGDAEEQVQDVATDAAAQGADTAVQHTPQQSPQPQPQPQPQAQQQAADFPMSLLQEALDACAALTRRGNRVKVLKLRRLKKVGSSQRIDTLKDTVMEDGSNQGRMIDDLDKDDVVSLMDDKEEEKKEEEVKDDQVQGRQAKIYKIDMDHASKVLIPAAATTTAAPVRVAAASTRRRKGVVIRDPEEKSITIIPTDTKSKDKGKRIMVEEPNPLKKKQQVEMDEEYARKLHEELNKDNDWNVAIEHVKQKAKEDLAMQRYQVMKKRPQTDAQALKNMIMYLKNVAGFRLDYFKGMSYDDIRPIFEAKFNSNIKFLLKTKEQLKEEESGAIQSINKTPAQKATKRRKLNEEVEDLKRHLEIFTDEDDDVYTEATPLARKIPVVDYEIIHLNNKPHYNII